MWKAESSSTDPFQNSRILRFLSQKPIILLVDIRKTGLTAKKLSEKLMKKGIIVRDCTSFKGLDEYWIRVSVGTLEQDEEFIKILEDIIG